MQHASIILKRSSHSKGNFSFGKKKLSESKIYTLPILSSFFVGHNIKPDKRIIMIISVKKILAHACRWNLIIFSKSAWQPICACQKPIHSQSWTCYWDSTRGLLWTFYSKNWFLYNVNSGSTVISCSVWDCVVHSSISNNISLWNRVFQPVSFQI